MNDENLAIWIKDVVREHHWQPNQISCLFCDKIDEEGILYWAEDVRIHSKEKNKKTK